MITILIPSSADGGYLAVSAPDPTHLKPIRKIIDDVHAWAELEKAPHPEYEAIVAALEAAGYTEVSWAHANFTWDRY